MEHKKCFKSVIALVAMLAMLLTFIPFMPTARAADTVIITATAGPTQNIPLYNALIEIYPAFGDDNAITDTELASITGDVNNALNLNSKGITSIEGLQYCDKVATLNLNYNSITNFPVDMSGMKALKKLYLDSSPGTAANYTSIHLPDLELLDISSSGVTDISFLVSGPGMPNLKNFVWNNCGLTRTNLQTLTSNAAQFPVLDTLSVANNDTLGDYSAQDIKDAFGGRLIYLDMSNCGLEGLVKLDGLNNLQRLYVPENNVQSLDGVENMGELKDLVVWNNEHLADISAVENLDKLEQLDIQNANDLTDISVVSTLKSLTSLNLWNCNSLTESDFTVLNDLPGLTKLWLAFDNISDLSAVGNMTNLEYLSLQGCRGNITDFSPISNLINLRSLQFSYYNLKDISFLEPLVHHSPSSALKYINLESDNITDITPIRDVTNATINLVNNKLDETPGSVDMLNIANLQSHGCSVDYHPQTTFTVNYECDYTKGTTTGTSVSGLYYGQNIKLPPVTATAGSVFKGWAKAWYEFVEGNPTTPVTAIYTFDSNATNYSVTYTAMFINAFYNVGFEPQNGTIGWNFPVQYNRTVYQPPAPTRTGYTFTNWYREPECVTPWNFALDTVTANIVLYGGWTPNNYTVSFDAQGGAASTGSKAVTYNAAYGTLPVPTKTGFSFAGWYTDGGARVTEASAVTTAADHTLHAAWQFMGPYLASIQNTCGTWNKPFVKTTYSYKIRLGENDPALTLTPVKENDGATLTANRALSGISPANGKSVTVKITVKYGKLKKTYAITVTRDKSSNNNLASLTAVGGMFDSPFDPADTSYMLYVGENTKSVTIKAAAAAGKLASVSPSSKKITLNNGDTKTVKITVKAQSGAKKVYTITVVRAPSTDANLKSLKASGGTLTPVFSAGNTNYSITLPANKSVVTLTAKPNGYKSTVYINDVKRTSLKVTLAASGTQIVHVRVVAQSGGIKDYYITVQKP